MIAIVEYPIVYRGSVKNVREVVPYTDDMMGEAIFEFTDDSSVKDYGKLPFQTPCKGFDLCAMAVQSFKDIENLGIPTIFKEQISENKVLVDYVRVLNPREVSLKKVRKNRLVPLECIIRNVITSTSSARRRLESGKLHFQALGLSQMPKSYPVILPKMYFDGSTKLDPTDEYLHWDALKELACESFEIMNQLELYCRQIGMYALKKGAAAGLIINDFKLEWALNNRGDLVLADIPLAIDEITSLYVGHPYTNLDSFKEAPFEVFVPGVSHSEKAFVNVSKQIYRDHYTAAEPEWVCALEKAKQTQTKYPPANSVPEALVRLCTEMFGGLRNLWCPQQQRQAPPLGESAVRYKEWASQFYRIRGVNEDRN